MIFKWRKRNDETKDSFIIHGTYGNLHIHMELQLEDPEKQMAKEPWARLYNLSDLHLWILWYHFCDVLLYNWAIGDENQPFGGHEGVYAVV